jgi:hypothetical protein
MSSTWIVMANPGQEANTNESLLQRDSNHRVNPCAAAAHCAPPTVTPPPPPPQTSRGSKARDETSMKARPRGSSGRHSAASHDQIWGRRGVKGMGYPDLQSQFKVSNPGWTHGLKRSKPRSNHGQTAVKGPLPPPNRRAAEPRPRPSTPAPTPPRNRRPAGAGARGCGAWGRAAGARGLIRSCCRGPTPACVAGLNLRRPLQRATPPALDGRRPGRGRSAAARACRLPPLPSPKGPAPPGGTVHSPPRSSAPLPPHHQHCVWVWQRPTVRWRQFPQAQQLRRGRGRGVGGRAGVEGAPARAPRVCSCCRWLLLPVFAFAAYAGRASPERGAQRCGRRRTTHQGSPPGTAATAGGGRQRCRRWSKPGQPPGREDTS